jgi:catechol 2,3-dioxygenase-like lactoylglutathione lyase family enzyme
VDVVFLSSTSVIAPDPAASRRLYADALGLPLHTAQVDDGYLYTEELAGSRHFGLWPLAQAAEACFGTPTWPSDRPVPQASIEFEVAAAAAVGPAAQELVDRGYTLLHEARTEPWGQTVARLQSPEGLVVGLSYAPWMHDTVLS